MRVCIYGLCVCVSTSDWTRESGKSVNQKRRIAFSNDVVDVDERNQGFDVG